jgi:AcrR family transcriptional regulator
MAPKTSVTRDMIVEAAVEVVREAGAEAVNVRAVARKLICSTQPVMYQFASMEYLKRAVYERIDRLHTEFLMRSAGERDPLLEIGLNYIRFAVEEPRLFRFLFQSGRFSGLSLEDLIRAPEAADVLAAVRTEEDLTTEEAAAFFEPLVAVVHGYASLIANNGMIYDPDTIRRALLMIAEGIERGRKQNDEAVSKE